ncbi:MAG: gamma-glutamyltransferase [Gemmatimonadota bacterium]|nr:gamma-glutamyltransferase [Gemmatimonadota bacterium]
MTSHRFPASSAMVVALVAAVAHPSAAQTVPRTDQRVVARHGVVAAAHPEAARAGLAMLRAGGNAIDAAVAAAFAVGVVEPMMSGVGGGGAMTLWLAGEGSAWHVEFYASSGERPDHELDRYDEDEAIADSLVAPERWVAVPGAVAGLLEAHERHGTLPREQVLAPAVQLARQGFIVHPLLATVIREAYQKLHYDRRAAALFYPDESPLQTGDRLVQPDLATTLERIQREGRDGYYRGATANEVVTALSAGANPITLSDLAGVTPRWRRPLCGIYRGYTVLTAPPPLAGVEVLQTLALLEPLDLRAAGLPIQSATVLGAIVDAIRVARADYDRWIGDPRDAGVPAVGMASRAYAVERSSVVDLASVPAALAPGDPWAEEHQPLPEACVAVGSFPATTLDRPVQTPGHSESEAEGETTHISVIDAEGNAVSLTYTLGLYFGTGTYIGGAFYNTASGNFGAPTANRRGPFRTPRSSTAPTLVLADGRIKMAVGSPASGRIPPAIVHTILYTLDYGLDPWTAVSMPRIYPYFSSPDVRLEPGFDTEVLAALRHRGYVLTAHGPHDLYFGGVTVVYVAEDGRLIGAADPRRDGAAVGY